MLAARSFQRAFRTSTINCKHVVPSNLKGKGTSSSNWLTRQLSDPYVEKAKMFNYRCRSAFKLIEIDDRFQFLIPGKVVIDCGAAPGSWSQVAAQRVNADGSQEKEPIGLVIAVDRQPFLPLPGVTILGNSDFTSTSTQDKLREILGEKQVDAVISDMAPSASGIKDLDNEEILNLCYSVLRFAVLVSKVDAVLIVKMWESGFTKMLQKDMERFYKSTKLFKPKASRSDSAEIFVFAKNFKGLKVT